MFCTYKLERTSLEHVVAEPEGGFYRNVGEKKPQEVRLGRRSDLIVDEPNQIEKGEESSENAGFPNLHLRIDVLRRAWSLHEGKWPQYGRNAIRKNPADSEEEPSIL